MSDKTDLLLAFIVVVAIVFSVLIVPRLLGVQYPLVVVEGRSMLPLLVSGDLVITTKATNVRIGDIIVYKSCTSPGSFIIHRVVDILRRGQEVFYVTKGDNNPYLDNALGEFRTANCILWAPGVPEQRVIGKVLTIRIGSTEYVVKIPLLGSILLELKQLI
ncbi:MAG: signal peptidase I [Crenarchaeota archaeon]|nr:signal peptidase I [Thermoproteota archaeon]